MYLTNGSNYDYYSIIKELTKGPEWEFNYLGGNTQKKKLFSSNNTWS